MDVKQHEPLAEIAVDAVTPEAHGFTLSGRAADGAEYRVGLRFELPLDARTRAALGEMLTQATVTVSRTRPAAEPRGGRARRDGAHQR